jgi:uncharacterized protein (UPF0333 family)
MAEEVKFDWTLLIILVVLVLGGVYFFFLRKKKPSQPKSAIALPTSASINEADDTENYFVDQVDEPFPEETQTTN